MNDQELKEAIQQAKAREAQHPHRVAAEYEHADEPNPSWRWIVRCACNKRFHGSTRGLAFRGYFRHRDRMNRAEHDAEMAEWRAWRDANIPGGE